jgi:hypothetical protein
MPKTALEDLIAILSREGFKVLSPVARDGSVAFDEVRKLSDLAVGMRDAQEPGRYRLVQGTAGEIFEVVNGAGSLKPFFFAPEETLLEVNRERRGFKVTEVAPAAPRLAFIGVRACDLSPPSPCRIVFFCTTAFTTRTTRRVARMHFWSPSTAPVPRRPASASR